MPTGTNFFWLSSYSGSSNWKQLRWQQAQEDDLCLVSSLSGCHETKSKWSGKRHHQMIFLLVCPLKTNEVATDTLDDLSFMSSLFVCHQTESWSLFNLFFIWMPSHRKQMKWQQAQQDDLSLIHSLSGCHQTGSEWGDHKQYYFHHHLIPSNSRAVNVRTPTPHSLYLIDACCAHFIVQAYNSQSQVLQWRYIDRRSDLCPTLQRGDFWSHSIGRVPGRTHRRRQC